MNNVPENTATLAKRVEAAILLARLRAVQEEIEGLPVLDHRTADEIIGYNAGGHFD